MKTQVEVHNSAWDSWVDGLNGRPSATPAEHFNAGFVAAWSSGCNVTRDDLVLHGSRLLSGVYRTAQEMADAIGATSSSLGPE